MELLTIFNNTDITSFDFQKIIEYDWTTSQLHGTDQSNGTMGLSHRTITATHHKEDNMSKNQLSLHQQDDSKLELTLRAAYLNKKTENR